MKLVTFSRNGGNPSSGALIDDDRNVVDLVAASKAKGRDGARLVTVLAVAEGGQGALDEAYDAIKGAAKDALHARDTVKLHAPIPHPPQMRDFLCFEKHLKQAFGQARKVRAQQSPDPAAAMKEMEEKNILSVPQAWYERPLYYHPNRFNVIGDGDEVVWPAYSQLMDFELEFGFYIGKPGRDITKDKAREHIFGYTIFNDFSARDEQTKEMPGQLGPGKGKDFDGGNSMGPCLVTTDELKDPYTLTMTCRVNGEEWGRGSSSEMGWKFEDCIAHAARSETLHSGEFFGSGTVGNGCGLEHMRFLKSGDVVELEVEGIGTLRNRVVRN